MSNTYAYRMCMLETYLGRACETERGRAEGVALDDQALPALGRRRQHPGMLAVIEDGSALEEGVDDAQRARSENDDEQGRQDEHHHRYRHQRRQARALLLGAQQTFVA